MKKLFLILLVAGISFSQVSQIPAGGGGSGGSSGSYSTASVGYGVGTTYFPPGGGLAANATETNVQGLVTIAGTISNFSANLSAAPGVGNAIAFTWRDNTTDQVLTCTISGGSATSCSDTSHSFAVAVNDLIDIKAVITGGTVTAIVVFQWGTPGKVGPTGPPGAGTAPYSTTTITASPMTITNATHGQGKNAFATCWDTSSNPQIEQGCNWSRNPTTGDITITYSTAPGQIDIFGGTGGFPNPMTAQGDIIYGGTSGAATKLSGSSGILRSNGTTPSYAELSGDVTTSGSNATSVVKVNGAAVPTSAAAVASNGSNQLIAATTTGSGSTVVLATSPTLTTPALGTPSALVLTNATSLSCGATPALTGDVTTTAGSCATTTVKVNGSDPASVAPSLTLGTANSAGAAHTVFSSNATILAFDATAPAVTTPLALSAVGVATVAARRDHTHQSPGGINAITGSSGSINNSETAVLTSTIPANFVQAGTTFLIKAYGTCTSTASNISTFKIRWGANGTTGDTLIGSVATANAATSGTNVPFMIEFTVTFQSTTVSEVNGILNNNGVTGITTTQTPIIGTPTNTTGLTTTSTEKLSLFYVSANTTTTSTFQIATIDVEKM